MPAHQNLTGNELHEPKGADTANDGQVYISDGAGSGTWERLQGWGQYQDTDRTVGSPSQTLSSGVRTKFTCDGGFLIEEYLPSDASSPFWNTSTNVMSPIAAFDTYDFRVSFTAENYAGTAPYIIVELDIGGGIGVILEETKPLLRSGDAMGVVLSWPVFSGTTFLANGGSVYLTYSGTGTCDIYKNSVLVKRSSRNG